MYFFSIVRALAENSSTVSPVLYRLDRASAALWHSDDLHAITHLPTLITGRFTYHPAQFTCQVQCHWPTHVALNEWSAEHFQLLNTWTSNNIWNITSSLVSPLFQTSALYHRLCHIRLKSLVFLLGFCYEAMTLSTDDRAVCAAHRSIRNAPWCWIQRRLSTCAPVTCMQ